MPLNSFEISFSALLRWKLHQAIAKESQLKLQAELQSFFLQKKMGVENV